MAGEMQGFVDNVARKLAPQHLDRAAERMHLLLKDLCAEAEQLASGGDPSESGSHAELTVSDSM